MFNLEQHTIAPLGKVGGMHDAEPLQHDKNREAIERPICTSCHSTKVGTLAKEITADTLWRCASCGHTFKTPKSSLR